MIDEINNVKRNKYEREAHFIHRAMNQLYLAIQQDFEDTVDSINNWTFYGEKKNFMVFGMEDPCNGCKHFTYRINVEEIKEMGMQMYYWEVK